MCTSGHMLHRLLHSCRLHSSVLLQSGQRKQQVLQVLRAFSSGEAHSYHKSSEKTEDMEHLQKNPYYAKYAAKMKQLQDSKPEEFQSKLNELEKQKETEMLEAQKQLDEAKEAAAVAQVSQTKPKRLDSVMKLELLQDKTAEEIGKIWKEYHSDKDYIYAVIPGHEFEEMHRRLKEFPNFLYPLPRGPGYEFFVQQFHAQNCHFTPLIQYQGQNENAPACLSLTHYTELMQDKGIVLMHGQPDVKVLSIYEAQLLSLQVKMYYGMNSGLKLNLVRMFNNSPNSFRHMDVIREFEKYKKDSKDFKDGEL